tara:strand:- start:1767 stop:2930 length:1164 start_codon:yes stop_codon:yes gene_type:complete
MKVLIINDGKYCSNWGLNASTKAILEFLKENEIEFDTILHKDLHKKYTLDPQLFGRRIFNEDSRIQKKFFPRYLKIPLTSDQYDLYCDLWNQGKGGAFSNVVIEKILKSDLVLYNAEGSTYRNNYGSLAGLFIIYFAKKILKKRSCFFNGSFTVSSVNNLYEGIAKRLHCEGIKFYVREEKSKESLSSINVPSVIIPDSVFYYASSPSSNKNSEYFAVSKSMLPMLIDKDNYRVDPFIELISNISDITGLKPLLLAKDPEDKYLLNLKNKLSSSLPSISSGLNFLEVQKLISNSRFLVSGRYHHLIFAANTSVNICCFSSSSHKIEGLAKLLSSKHNSIPTFDPTDIINYKNNILEYCQSLLSMESSWDQFQLKNKFTEKLTNILYE